MECFGIVASYSLNRPPDVDFFKPRRGADNAPHEAYGTALDYQDYTQGFGGYRPFKMNWQWIEAPDAAAIYHQWDLSRTFQHSYKGRVWVNYFDVLAGEWRVNSAVLLQPNQQNVVGGLYQGFSITITKLGIHTFQYQGGNSPFDYSGDQWVYGDSEFQDDSFRLPKPDVL